MRDEEVVTASTDNFVWQGWREGEKIERAHESQEGTY